MTNDAVMAVRNKLYQEREQVLNEWESLGREEAAMLQELDKIRAEMKEKLEYAEALKEAAEQFMANIKKG